jgi:hypothetical protein
MLTNVAIPWYYLPVLPALAYFSLVFLAHNEKNKMMLDKFFYFAFALFLACGFFIGLYSYSSIRDAYNNQRELGEFLAFKENVYIIGYQTQTVVAYKVLEEKKAGKNIDYGWVFMGNPQNTTQEVIQNFVNDYHYNKSSLDIKDGSFSRIYWENSIFRKTTAIKKPDYIALVFINESNNITVNGTIVFDNNDTRVYRMNN